ncbi:MAG: hypothetical protein IT438_15065 [Phycisphaerales bacterium]|nr:hypothetical protein [Phycisphaerales bacterium]
MTLEITPNTHKAYIPRVEFIAVWQMMIGTSVPEPDASMEAGVVWSGDLLDGPGGNNPANDYAEFVVSGPVVTAVSPTADLWATGVVQDILTIRRDLLGEAHLPNLGTGQFIRIGEKLGDRQEEEWGCFTTFLNPVVQPCMGQSDVVCQYPCALNAGETSPRAFEGGVQLATVGRVLLAAPSSLQGQTIINAENTIAPQEDGWIGQFVVGTDATPPITLRPDGARPDIAPYYARPSARTTGDPGVVRLGGGAVGLATFHMHDEDSVPPNGQTGPTQGVAAGEFFVPGAVPVVFRHYGPVLLNTAVASSWTQAFIVEAKSGAACVWTGMGTSGLFQVSGPGDPGWSDNRAIGLSKLSGAQPKSGIFRLRPVPGAILSDMVTGNPEVIWDHLSCDDEPSYEFRILPDCDLDGTPDHDDPDFVFCPVNFCAADYDDSGGVSVQDIFDYLTAYFAGQPCANFNGVGGLGIQDLFDFLGAYFSAPTGQLCDPAARPNCPNCSPVSPPNCQ